MVCLLHRATIIIVRTHQWVLSERPCERQLVVLQSLQHYVRRAQNYRTETVFAVFPVSARSATHQFVWTS